MKVVAFIPYEFLHGKFSWKTDKLSPLVKHEQGIYFESGFNEGELNFLCAVFYIVNVCDDCKVTQLLNLKHIIVQLSFIYFFNKLLQVRKVSGDHLMLESSQGHQ